ATVCRWGYSCRDASSVPPRGPWLVQSQDFAAAAHEVATAVFCHWRRVTRFPVKVGRWFSLRLALYARSTGRRLVVDLFRRYLPLRLRVLDALTVSRARCRFTIRGCASFADLSSRSNNRSSSLRRSCRGRRTRWRPSSPRQAACASIWRHPADG